MTIARRIRALSGDSRPMKSYQYRYDQHGPASIYPRSGFRRLWRGDVLEAYSPMLSVPCGAEAPPAQRVSPALARGCVGGVLPDAVSSLRRGSPARVVGFTGFGARMCWRRTPRCCQLPAARKPCPRSGIRRFWPGERRGAAHPTPPVLCRAAAAPRSGLRQLQSDAAIGVSFSMRSALRPGASFSALAREKGDQRLLSGAKA